MDKRILLAQEAHNRTSKYPSEYVLQGEMFIVLRRACQLAGKRWTALLEAKSSMPASKRGDILLYDVQRIIFELKCAIDLTPGSNDFHNVCGV